MILKASQRGGGTQLARHLMNLRDNDHVGIHELRGFVGNGLESAFKEAHAISLGTKCSQFLFSLSLSPPEMENVPIEIFEDAIDRIEKKIGLLGQPRAVVFHEKNGRRHCHVVWSRIDPERLRAINLSHYKLKLQDISRQLFLENNWQMPPGLQQGMEPDALNYSMAEGQQAARVKLEPKTLKALFQRCWAQSDSKPAFAAALKEHGFILAKGDRRGFVAVDQHGEIYSISRWVGIKVKEVRARLGSPDDLPQVDEALGILTAELPEELEQEYSEGHTQYEAALNDLEEKRKTLATEHRKARALLRQAQDERVVREIIERVDRLPNGVKAVLAKLTGRYQKIKARNAAEFETAQKRDRYERQELIRQQLAERRTLQHEICSLQLEHEINTKTLQRDIGKALDTHDFKSDGNFRLPSIDPRQPLVIPEEDGAQSLAAKVRRSPQTILEVITDKKVVFTHNDMLCGLADYIDDPQSLSNAIDEVLLSRELIVLQGKPARRFTTREMQSIEKRISNCARAMATKDTFAVKDKHIKAAISAQNSKLQRIAAANLSQEQIAAIHHVLSRGQLKAVVGYAGAGKSTLLEAAKAAFEAQGYRVLGAALSGKAADSLEKSAGIESRTLASLEHSWKNGFNNLQSSDILIIDEAGMVGSRQLLRFIEEVRKSGCKLVMVGDYDQLQPIAAGRPFKDIVKNIGCTRLTEIRRQNEDWQRDASRDLANLNIAKAMELYRKRGFVTCTEDRSQAIAKLVEDYIDDINERGQDASRLALAHRRIDVHLINQSVRKALKEQGVLLDENLINTDHGPRAFATGDRILFTRNDRELGLRNGMLGCIESIDGDLMAIKLDSDTGNLAQQIRFSAKNYRSLDHGYCSTIHKSQGATIDRAFVMASTTMDKHLTYVAMTRHREQVVFYIDQRTNGIMLGKNKLNHSSLQLDLRNRPRTQHRYR